MHLFFDESGDFGFPEDRFDCYVQAGVACPDSYLPALAEFASSRRQKWRVAELHATELTPGQRLVVCRFIASSPLALVALTVDSEMNTRETILRWRLAQAARLERSLQWYRSRGGPSAELEQWMTQGIKRTGLAQQISDADFVNANLFVDVIFQTLQRSVVEYTNDRWRAEFEEFSFVIDGKLPGKLGAGEKYLRDSVLPILSSNRRFRLTLPAAWLSAEPVHPFVERFEGKTGWIGTDRARGQGTDLSGIFEHGLRFEDSRDHVGLQLADTVAHAIRNAVVNPHDRQAQLGYALLRSKLWFNGRAFTIAQLDPTARPDAARYSHLR